MALKGVSLFANIGVAEAYFGEIGVEVCVANELIKRRAKLYSEIYPETDVIEGDFNDSTIYNEILLKAKQNKIDFIMATPPCQGMSTAGRQNKNDKRNDLIIPTIKFIKEVNPKYVVIENVPQFIKTKVHYKNQEINILDLINKELGSGYKINASVIDTKDYNIAQSRKRAIITMTRNNITKTWLVPKKHKRQITLKDVIGDNPIIDPFIKDVTEAELLQIFPNYYKRRKKALKISKWNLPPTHVKRQVIAMMHTPTGKSAFENSKYKPKKENGEIIKGFKNTYKRQNWDTPAYAITMDNRKISSQDNVHPGRKINDNSNGQTLYSDPRTLTLYELMKVMSLPNNWPIPKDTSEAFIRRVIGEGVPPLFIKQLFQEII
jgi:DNA (cytosine-5)-methyltransferase 1